MRCVDISFWICRAGKSSAGAFATSVPLLRAENKRGRGGGASQRPVASLGLSAFGAAAGQTSRGAEQPGPRVGAHARPAEPPAGGGAVAGARPCALFAGAGPCAPTGPGCVQAGARASPVPGTRVVPVAGREGCASAPPAHTGGTGTGTGRRRGHGAQRARRDRAAAGSGRTRPPSVAGASALVAAPPSAPPAPRTPLLRGLMVHKRSSSPADVPGDGSLPAERSSPALLGAGSRARR